MLKLFTFLLCFSVLTGTALAQKTSHSMQDSSMPKFYKKRTEAVFNIGLVYYGDYYSHNDLKRVSELLTNRFELATQSALKLNIKFQEVIPFKHQISDYPNYVPFQIRGVITDIERLQRIWYYDQKNSSVVNEIYELAKTNDGGRSFAEIDSLVVITGAQFDDIAFTSGRVVVAENPREVAWGLPDGGRVDYISDEKIVDVLIHEMGHAMYMGHASTQCFAEGMDYLQSIACCEQSPSKNDVLSYCRNREAVNENFFYSFESCNMKTIKNRIIPAMLKGGEWAPKQLEVCE